MLVRLNWPFYSGRVVHRTMFFRFEEQVREFPDRRIAFVVATASIQSRRGLFFFPHRIFPSRGEFPKPTPVLPVLPQRRTGGRAEKGQKSKGWFWCFFELTARVELYPNIFLAHPFAPHFGFRTPEGSGWGRVVCDVPLKIQRGPQSGLDQRARGVMYVKGGGCNPPQL